MTLKEQIAADIVDVFLNVDEFAVSAEYSPADGGGKRTITVTPCDEKMRRYEPQRNHETRVGTLMTLVDKDATTGILIPQKLDTLKIGSQLWSFDEIVEEDEAAFVLRWKDATLYSAGRQESL